MSKEEKLKKLNENLAELEAKVADPDIGKGTADTFMRITGYVRAYNSFNRGKQAEVQERKSYKLA